MYGSKYSGEKGNNFNLNDNNSSGFSNIDNIEPWLANCSEENSKIFEEKYLKMNGILNIQKNKTKSTFVTGMIKEEENYKEDDKKEDFLYLPIKFSTLPHEDIIDDNINLHKNKVSKQKQIKLLKLFDLIPFETNDKESFENNNYNYDEEQENDIIQYLSEIKEAPSDKKIFSEITKRNYELNQKMTAISSICKNVELENTFKSNTPKKRIEISADAPIFIPKEMSNFKMNHDSKKSKLGTPTNKELFISFNNKTNIVEDLPKNFCKTSNKEKNDQYIHFNTYSDCKPKRLNYNFSSKDEVKQNYFIDNIENESNFNFDLKGDKSSTNFSNNINNDLNKFGSNESLESKLNSITISESTLSNSKDLGNKNLSNFNFINFVKKNNSHGLKHNSNIIGVVNESDKNISLENIIIGKDKRKTIMLRNVPLKYTMENILDEINPLFAGKFDYINMPFNSDVRHFLF